MSRYEQHTGDAVSPELSRGSPMITTEEFEYMKAQPGAPMTNEAGDCTVHYASGDNSFVMSGPTGIHILFAGATNLDRLNAHWFFFSGGR